MGLTVTPVKVWANGDRKEAIYDITFDSSYPTGGEALTKATLGLEIELNYVSDAVAWNGTLAVLTKYDYVNSKLVAFKSNTAANPQEVGDTASLANYKARLHAIGKGQVTA